MTIKKYLWEILLTLLLLFAAIVLLTQYQAGEKQNVSWTQDYQKYSEATRDLSNGKTEEALSILQALAEDPHYADSASIQWSLGNAYAVLRYLEPAEKAYIKARTIYPAYAVTDEYLKNYAILKFNQNDYEESRKCLLKLSEITSDQEVKAWAENALGMPEFN